MNMYTHISNNSLIICGLIIWKVLECCKPSSSHFRKHIPQLKASESTETSIKNVVRTEKFFNDFNLKLER